MWLRHLSLVNFRNYREQELELPRGVSLILGENAQGKSNLLEAVFLLATTRSARAQADGELINWDTLDQPQPFARLDAQVECSDSPFQLELIVAARPPGRDPNRIPASKRLRVNGIARRLTDGVGQLMAVLFTTDDIELVTGAPAGRRRFLDVMLSQLDRSYARSLSQYNKVAAQRNALLRRIQDGDAKPGELSYWDGELAGAGAVLVGQRALAVEALASRSRDAHERLSAGSEQLEIAYEPRLDGWDATRASNAGADEIVEALRDKLERVRARDIAAGATLSGPHRDDVSLMLDGVAAASFASRGQQRTAALALRLAEARYMGERRGDLPVVLLDDVLSELDEGRRRAVLESLGEWDQILITSADGDRFGEGLPQAAVFRVRAGKVEDG